MSGTDATGTALIDAAVDFILTAEALEGGHRNAEEREAVRYIVTGTLAYINSTAFRHGYGELAQVLLANLPDEVPGV